MFTVTDVIKNRFLEELTEITPLSLLSAVGLSFVLCCFVLLVYRLTYGGVLFSKSFALSLLLLSMTTSLVILTISSNVVLSLGMVGALSIVRFRTAVKEPMDTIYMFWAIVVGITTGAGLVPTAILATLLIGGIFLLVHWCSGKWESTAYLIVVRYHPQAAEAVQQQLSQLKRARIKSCSSTPNGEELVLEARIRGNFHRALAPLKHLPGVTELNVSAYRGSTLQ